MSLQIFKEKLPNDLLIELLNQICIKTEHNNYYVINNEAFKRGLYNNAIIVFIDKCKSYYHKSKLKYLERKLTYKTFVTIIRQICNANNITYTSQIRYQGSSYDIIYYIHIHKHNVNP
jgi:hypothetical protein